MQPQERCREDPIEVQEDEAGSQETKCARGRRVALGRVQQRNDRIREDDENQRHPHSREREEAERFLDHDAELGARAEGQPRKHWIEDRACDDRRDDRGRVEQAVGRRVPADVLSRRHALEHHHVDAEVEGRRDPDHPERDRAAKETNDLVELDARPGTRGESHPVEQHPDVHDRGHDECHRDRDEVVRRDERDDADHSGGHALCDGRD